MLKTRIVTAVLLFAVFFFALFYLPPSGWVAFATLTAAVASWEWGGLMGLRMGPRIAMGAGFAAVCVGIAVLNPAAMGLGELGDGFAETAWNLGRWFYIPSLAFWLLVVPIWMNQRWLLPKFFLGLIVGILVIFPTWLALVQLKQAGVLSLLAIMATVWVADIFAYVFGRTFGRHKLAPSISPGKTWEGALGGGCAVIVYGLLLRSKLPVALSDNYFLLLFVFALLTVISVIGDLFESLLKRQAGLKDSSSILPGHGGVLDRIDSLTSTLPLVALVWLNTLH